MASGIYATNGSDLDDVFDPYVEGTKPAATNFIATDGTDLAQRYAPLSYGSAAAATGCHIANGADLNTLWAAAGTASYYTPMSNAVLNRTSLSEKGAGTGSTTLITDSVTASVSGGNPSKTYTWERVSGAALGLSDQNGATTTFNSLDAAVSRTSVFRCKITDGVGTIYTPNVSINFTHYQVFPATFEDQVVSGSGSQLLHIKVRRNGVVERIANGGNTTVLGDWVTPKSSTVGDNFSIRFDDDDTVPDDDDDLNTANNATTPAPGTWGAINTDRVAAHNGSSGGLQPHVTGVRIQIRLTGVATNAIDKSIGLKTFSS